MDKFRLFFSYRTLDADHIRDLQASLRKLLPQMLFDDVSLDVPFDDDWKTPASSIIEKYDMLICVVGAETHNSEAVDWEIREASRLRKPLVVTDMSREYTLPLACSDLHIPVMDWNILEVAGRIGELLVSRALFQNHDSGTEINPTLIWNQYNLMVQSSEALVNRRQTVNTLYVSANVALLAAIGILISSIGKIGEYGTVIGVGLLGLLGAALSFNWRRTLISYGTLNKAKFKVIAALEELMPARLFDAEWRVLEARRYKSTTDTDKQTALFFSLIFLVLAMVALGIYLGSNL